MVNYIIIVALAIAFGQTLSLVFMMKLMASSWFAKKMAKMSSNMQKAIIDEM